MRNGFAVTFESVTDESAEEGEAADSGFVGEGLSLRDAVDMFHRERSGGHIEADSWPTNAPRWLTACGERDMWTGEFRSVSLHLPRGITPASARRVARLVGFKI